MRILEIDPQPIDELPFLNAGRSTGDWFEDSLPVFIGTVDCLPSGVAAIIATGDLQGREHFRFQRDGNGLRLLGEWLPDVLQEKLLPGIGIGQGDIGVLLAGDFFTVPNLDKRGGSGDVTEVWTAFGRSFSWVVGVAGNHDTFGNAHSKPPRFRSPLHFLDETIKHVGGLTVAGISGIPGDPRKPWRKIEEQFESFIASLQSQQPDILLMHDGPNIPELELRGSGRIREALSKLSKPLIVRGHAHWDQALAELPNGIQVLNVDARVIILRPA